MKIVKTIAEKLDANGLDVHFWKCKTKAAAAIIVYVSRSGKRYDN